MAFLLKLDQVNGAALHKGVYAGRYTRVALAINLSLPAGSIPDTYALCKSLGAVGLPQIGDSLDPAGIFGFQKWYLRDYLVTPSTAKNYIIQLIYVWNGQTIIRDNTSQQTIVTQMHPSGQALYLKYKNPNDPNDPGATKVVNASVRYPLRHFSVTKTIDFQASPNVLAAFGGVNDQLWEGLPTGYWQLSDLDGETLDNGITYTYTAVWSTQQIVDWSVYHFFEDSHRQAYIVPQAKITALKAKPYVYAIDSSVNGVLKVGYYPTVNFYSIFGIQ